MNILILLICWWVRSNPFYLPTYLSCYESWLLDLEVYQRKIPKILAWHTLGEVSQGNGFPIGLLLFSDEGMDLHLNGTNMW